MVTTVTISTATAVTVAGASLVLIAIVALLALLIQQEIISSSEGATAARLGRALNIALIPLVFVFLTTLVIKAIGILS